MNKENIFSTKSESGIRILGERIPGSRSVSVCIWVKAGPVYENENERGISHFIEHMLFKGTESRSAKQIAAEIDNIGGSINAFTAMEKTCFYTRTLDEDIELAVDILLDMVCSPKLSDADIENEKGVVCEEILMSADDPADVAHETLYSTIYKGYPLEYSILGTQESVKKLDRDTIKAYMDRRYVPENIVISCAGNFDPERVVKLVNEKYKPRENRVEAVPRERSVYEKGRRFKFVKKDVEQAHICLSFPSNSYGDDTSMTMSIIDNVFGGASSSRLFQSIREEKGLAYSVYSAREAYEETGYWVLYAATAENRAVEVVNCMLSELKRLRQDGLTEQEFLRSKQQLRRSFILTLEGVPVHAVTLGKDMLHIGRYRDSDEFLNALDKVTLEDVNALIRKTVDADYMCAVLVSGDKTEGVAKEIEALTKEASFC